MKQIRKTNDPFQSIEEKLEVLRNKINEIVRRLNEKN